MVVRSFGIGGGDIFLNGKVVHLYLNKAAVCIVCLITSVWSVPRVQRSCRALCSERAPLNTQTAHVDKHTHTHAHTHTHTRTHAHLVNIAIWGTAEEDSVL